MFENLKMKVSRESDEQLVISNEIIEIREFSDYLSP